MKTRTKSKNSKIETQESELVQDLRRHICSLTVLAFRYQIHIPHLLSPGLAKVSDNFLTFGHEIRGAIASLTRRVNDLNGEPVSRVEDIEESAYLSLGLSQRFDLSEVAKSQAKAEQRLVMMLSHTSRRSERMNDVASFEVIKTLVAESHRREQVLSSFLK